MEGRQTNQIREINAKIANGKKKEVQTYRLIYNINLS